MSCAASGRHEQLLSCPHQLTAAVLVDVRTADGCSGRVCQGCFGRLGVGQWPDVAERIGGPARGLDALQALRALRQRPPGDNGG